MAQYDINLREYWRILKKRKFIVILTAIVLGVFSTFFAVLRAPTPLYNATSGIKFEKEILIPGFSEIISWSGPGDVETLISVINSYEVIQRAAEKLGKIPKRPAEEGLRLSPSMSSILDNLQSKVEVEREGYTNIINISVTDADPAFAQQFANTLARTYKEMHAEEQSRRTTEALKYIARQLSEVREKLREAEDEFNRFTQKHQLVSYDLQSESLLLKAKEMRDEIREVKEGLIELDQLRAKLERFIQDPSGSGEGFYSAYANQQYQNVNNTLVELSLKRDSLREDYTDKHPEVIEHARRIVEHARKMVMILELQMERMEKKKADLAQQLADVDRKTADLMEKKLEYDRLNRTVKSYSDMAALLERKNQEGLIRKAENPEEVTLVRPALLPALPINPPRTTATGTLGVVVGLVLGLVLAFVVETFDTSMGAIEDVEETLGAEVLGVIPHGDIREIAEKIKRSNVVSEKASTFSAKMPLASHFARQSMLAESFRALRTNIQFRNNDKKIKTIAVTSGSPQEGKTTVAANLAITMAQAGMKTLLLGSDLRKPMIAQIFGVDSSPGLADILLGNYAWRDAVKTITDIIIGKMELDEVMLTPGLDNLHLITSGTIPPNPAELVDSEHLEGFIKEVKENYDIVIFDSPPVLSTADATILGTKTDAVLLVYRVGSISRGLLKRTTVQLKQVKSHLIGVVLNGMRPEVSPDFQEFKYYKYYYSYGGEGVTEREEKRPSKKRKRRKSAFMTGFLACVALAIPIAGMVWQSGHGTAKKNKLGSEDPVTSAKYKEALYSKAVQPEITSNSGGIRETSPAKPGRDSISDSGLSRLRKEKGEAPIEGKDVERKNEGNSPGQREQRSLHRLSGENGRPDSVRDPSGLHLQGGRMKKEGVPPLMVRIKVPVANLRARPTTESLIVYKLKRGAQVQLLRREGEWCIVQFRDGRASWAHQSVLEEAAKPWGPFHKGQAKTWGERVAVHVQVGRVREAPSSEAKICYGLNKGDIVTIQERDGDWLLVELEDGRLGWAHQILFSKVAATSESRGS